MENTNPLFSKAEIITPNWNKIPNGSKFTGKIKNIDVEGRIYRNPNGTVFLCQNMFDGSLADFLFEFEYSWSIGNGTLDNMLSNNTIITNIELDPNFTDITFKPILVSLNNDYDARVSAIGINVGCQFISFSSFDKLAEAVEEMRSKFPKKDGN